MLHPLSLQLAAQAATLAMNRPSGVISCSVVRGGFIDLVLHVDATQFSYGIRSWVLRVGGEGIGDEVGSVAAMYGGTVKCPVAVRFVQIGAPFAMHGVDDTGFVSSDFWDEEDSGLQLRSHPTLRKIAQQGVRWLTGAHVGAVVRAASASSTIASNSATSSYAPACGRKKDDLTRWLELEKHTLAKVQVIHQYRKVCKNVEMYTGHFRPEWLAPAFQQFVVESASLSTKATTTTTTSPSTAVDWLSLVEESSPGIYSFDLFSPTCDGAYVLLSRGASPNVEDIYGRTPIFLAALNGNVHCVRLLIAYGIDLSKRGKLGLAKGRDVLMYIDLIEVKRRKDVVDQCVDWIHIGRKIASGLNGLLPGIYIGEHRGTLRHGRGLFVNADSLTVKTQ